MKSALLAALLLAIGLAQYVEADVVSGIPKAISELMAQRYTRVKTSLSDLRKSARGNIRTIQEMMKSGDQTVNVDIEKANELGIDLRECLAEPRQNIGIASKTAVSGIKACLSTAQSILQPEAKKIKDEIKEVRRIHIQSAKDAANCENSVVCQMRIIERTMNQTIAVIENLELDSNAFGTDLESTRNDFNSCVNEQTSKTISSLQLAYQTEEHCIQEKIDA